MVSERIKDRAINDAYALMQMYQAGFLDGVNTIRRRKMTIYSKKLQKACTSCFEIRFGKIFKKEDKEDSGFSEDLKGGKQDEND